MPEKKKKTTKKSTKKETSVKDKDIKVKNKKETVKDDKNNIEIVDQDNENNKVYLDLKQQLIDNGNYSPYTEDLLQQYMTFTYIEEALNLDIKTRGVSVYWSNGGGQEGWKKNDSITELNRVNLQKIKLLGYLGIKAPKPEKEAGEDEYEV